MKGSVLGRQSGERLKRRWIQDVSEVVNMSIHEVVYLTRDTDVQIGCEESNIL
jgi:hypothetical protein